MEAVVLVGGQGTRLRPLTLTTPKPLLPCANVAFVAHQLARLRAAGVEHVVLATSYRAEVFAEAFGDGAGFGLRVDYVTEVEALGTGGGIRNVAGRLESAAAEPVFVLNGDVLSGHDMAAQLQRHRDTGAAATLHLVRVPDPRAFGSVPTDGDGRVRAFVEKSPQPVTDQVNAGCYVLTRAVIDAIPAGQVVSVERDVFPQLLADGAVLSGYLDDAYWIDVGTPASYVRASADLVRGLVTSPLVATAGESSTAPDAQVAGDAHLLGGSAVGAGAVIEDGAVVDGSVVLAGARVGAGAKVLRSVVGAAASVGAGAVLEDAVIGDAAYVGARNRLLVGARLWPRVTLPDV